MSIIVSKWGNSLGIRLPQSVANQLDITADDKLEFSITKGKLTLKKATEPTTLEELFKDYNGESVAVRPVIPISVGDEKW